MKTKLIPLIYFASVCVAAGNAPPAVVIQSAAMRPGTTLMDVAYRVNDPDDATVKVRALAFVDGVRSFANVLRPVTFEEGTGVNLGDAIASNANHTLTWNVGPDWDIDLGQVKFEILARDSRGLLEFDWVTIPAVGGEPGFTISANAPTDAELLNALFWQYAAGDPGLTLEDGNLRGNESSGVIDGAQFASGTNLGEYGTVYVLKKMNLDGASLAEVQRAEYGLRNPIDSTRWHAANRPFSGIVVGWGFSQLGLGSVPVGLTNVTVIDAGGAVNLALSNGKVIAWGWNGSGGTNVPEGLTNVTAIAAGSYHNLALKDDGAVVAWGSNGEGESSVPAGLTNVTAIAASTFGNDNSHSHSLALKNDGTVVAWGSNSEGQSSVPGGLTNVTAIAAGGEHSLALKNDGTVVAWGSDSEGQSSTPGGLTNVTAIAAGGEHSLALKSDGTVVAWGSNVDGQSNVPAELTDVTAIAAGSFHNLVLKNDGTVVAWGSNIDGESSVPAGLANVSAITAGYNRNLVLRTGAP